MFNYEEFKKENHHPEVTPFYYMKILGDLYSIPEQVLTSFAELLFSPFASYQNRVLLKHTSNKESYDLYRSKGMSPDESQFWVNLVNVSYLFPNMELQQQLSIGQMIQKAWKTSIHKVCSKDLFIVEIVEKESVFISCSCSPKYTRFPREFEEKNVASFVNSSGEEVLLSKTVPRL